MPRLTRRRLLAAPLLPSLLRPAAALARGLTLGAALRPCSASAAGGSTVLVAPWIIGDGTKLRRAAPAPGSTRDGQQVVVAPDQPRFTDDGALILEPPDTGNRIRNPAHDGQEDGGPGRLARHHRLTLPGGIVRELGRTEFGGLAGTTLRLQGLSTVAGGLFYAPEDAATFRALIQRGGTWCFSNQVALLAGSLPAGALGFMRARESGPAPFSAEEGTVPVGTAPEARAPLTGALQRLRVRKTVARPDSTALDFGFVLTIPAGIPVDATIFLADAWKLEEGRFATSPSVGAALRPEDRLEALPPSGREGTLVLDLTVPERAAEERPVLRLEGTVPVELCVVPESFALVARRGAGTSAEERTGRSHNLIKGRPARVALCWSRERFAFAVGGQPLEWCPWPTPDGFTALSLGGFGGTVARLVHYDAEAGDGTLRRLSRSDTPLPDEVASRNGVADGEAGLRMRDDPNRSPLHLTSPRDKINDPNGPFWDPVRRRYHVGFQYSPTGIQRRDGVRPPEFPNPLWAHASGADLVELRFRGVWLRPGFGTPGARDCSSGSVIRNTENSPVWEKPGSFTLYHTGGGLGFAADSEDGERWQQDFTPIISPAIAAQLSGLPVTETRDPAVFDHEGTRYLVQGAKVPGQGPCLLLFRFTGRRELAFAGILYRYTAGVTLPGDEGTDRIWECADLQRDEHSGRWVMLYSIGHTIAVVGDLDPATGRFREMSRRIVDAGRSYAGKLFHDRDGHLAWISWNAENRDGDGNDAAGQDGVLSLPMRISVDAAGRLQTRFHPDVLLRRENERALARTDGAAAGFRTEAFHLLLRGRGDILVEFTDDTGVVCRARLDRAGRRFGATNQPVRDVPFASGETVTLEAIRGGSVFHLLLRGEDSGEELLVTSRAYTTPPATPLDPQRPCGTPGIRLPGGAALLSAVVADLRPASADRFTS
ncbi:glycoside hydrolase family 32 protein [Roseomonas elaeocarpi]|uniref:beta-fructofuranosidase n=1 Tax=Roseomonas elaeocarpi TaxID=907779 RepID=A0ABV6JQJ7_9PROT